MDEYLSSECEIVVVFVFFSGQTVAQCCPLRHLTPQNQQVGVIWFPDQAVLSSRGVHFNARFFVDIPSSVVFAGLVENEDRLWRLWCCDCFYSKDQRSGYRWCTAMSEYLDPDGGMWPRCHKFDKCMRIARSHFAKYFVFVRRLSCSSNQLPLHLSAHSLLDFIGFNQTPWWLFFLSAYLSTNCWAGSGDNSFWPASRTANGGARRTRRPKWASGGFKQSRYARLNTATQAMTMNSEAKKLVTKRCSCTFCLDEGVVVRRSWRGCEF